MAAERWAVYAAAGLLLALLPIPVLLGAAPAPLGGEAQGLWARVYELFKRVEVLGAQGMNVSLAANLINRGIEALEKGDLAAASALLDRAGEVVAELERDLPAFSTWSRFRLYATVGGLLAVPVLFYLLFPRVYVGLWYRARRRWLVEDRR